MYGKNSKVVPEWLITVKYWFHSCKHSFMYSFIKWLWIITGQALCCVRSIQMMSSFCLGPCPLNSRYSLLDILHILLLDAANNLLPSPLLSVTRLGGKGKNTIYTHIPINLHICVCTCRGTCECGLCLLFQTIVKNIWLFSWVHSFSVRCHVVSHMKERSMWEGIEASSQLQRGPKHDNGYMSELGNGSP